MRVRLVMAAALVSVLAVPACDQRPNLTEAERVAAKGVESLWLGQLVSTQPSEVPLGWFEQLDEFTPEALRAVRYEVIKDSRTPWIFRPPADPAFRVRAVGGVGVEIDLAGGTGLREVDAAWGRAIASADPELAAARLDKLDAMFAGIMRAGADAQAHDVYRLAALWRMQILTRMAELGLASESLQPRKRIDRLKALHSARPLTFEVP